MPLRLALVAAALGAPAWLHAQVAAPPMPQLPPPLYVRIAGPAGMKVTAYRGAAPPQTFTAPCTFAFRPGYRCRLQLGGIEGRPGISLFPSFDVIGSLRLPHGVRAADHPVTIAFSMDDLAAVAAGNVVTKLVVLERPETAIPVATKADGPIELDLQPNRDLFKEALPRGRPLMLVRVGERQLTPQEVGADYVPGTMLLPAERVLPAPRDPPCLPWLCYPLIDPIAGEQCPEDEMCFHDGGDEGTRAGLAPDGKLRGLDPSDTIAQYHDSEGLPRIAISNKVCFCVPRYLVLRTEMTTASNIARTGPGDTRVVHAPGEAQKQVVPLEQHGETGPGGLSTQVRPAAVQNTQQVSVTGKVEGVEVRDTIVGTGDVTGTCAPPTTEVTGKPLIIIKWPDRCDPQLGEIVTFFIQYKHHGQKPITNIVVHDSLTPRLEYVKGSARTDRDALFTVTPNEAGSVVLRWEVTQPLLPGQVGTVSFQARVR
jgi:uncharacterized repeat protein (TIGR01451 family)